jgi:hypothetical protein
MLLLCYLLVFTVKIATSSGKNQVETKSAGLDDSKCDAQLKYYSDSLSKRETWAIDRKIEKHSVKKIADQMICSV